MPKTPELNRLAERMKRTIMERVQSMLAHAKLPKTFWVEALSTAIYVINRTDQDPESDSDEEEILEPVAESQGRRYPLRERKAPPKISRCRARATDR